MKYLHKYNTKAAHDAVYNGSDYQEPWVAKIENDKLVTYNKKDYSKDYLTFEALETGTFSLKIPSSINSTYMTSVSYSTNNGKTWTTINVTSSDQTITTQTINVGDKVLWKGIGKQMSEFSESNCFSCFSSTCNFNIYGNIMSMLYGDNFANQTALPNNSDNFRSLFRGSNVVDASNLKLPATTLTVNCYRAMFGDCTSLTTMPDLPAMNLADGCYFNLFNGCSSLTNIVSQLPATTLVSNCYRAMFQKCSSLTTIPTDLLPATTMMDSCYKNMFNSCTSLTNVPNLPATTLAAECYYQMFPGCTSLTTLPNNLLPAKTLTTKCYYSMFNTCTSLTNIPALPATTLSDSCYLYMFYNCRALTTLPKTLLPATKIDHMSYYGMFMNCSSITTVPDLPATILGDYCYQNMFNGCTSLIMGPILPATTLTSSCYNNMFNGCTSLTIAPELPAKTLADYCYYRMFYGCSNLNYIKAMFTTTPSTTYTRDWVSGVASSGTFVKNSAATWNVTGVNGIPTGWTVETASA